MSPATIAKWYSETLAKRLGRHEFAGWRNFPEPATIEARLDIKDSEVEEKFGKPTTP